MISDDLNFTEIKFDKILNISGFIFSSSFFVFDSYFAFGLNAFGCVFFENTILNNTYVSDDFGAQCSFSNSFFAKRFSVYDCKIPNYFDLFQMNVNGIFDITKTLIVGDINIGRSKFESSFDAKYLEIYGRAAFDLVEFCGVSNFDNSNFGGSVSFERAQFKLDTSFVKGKFSATKKTKFCYTYFGKSMNFLNTTFQGDVSFSSARFERCAPRFHGAKLHESIRFDDTEWPKLPHLQAWPGVRPTDGDAKPGQATSEEDKKKWELDQREADRQTLIELVSSYQVLKQAMESQKRHSDELDFFARELAAQRALEGAWSRRGIVNWLYKVTSNYGQSLVSPLCWLGVIILAFGVVFDGIQMASGTPLGAIDALGLSIKSAFGIFTFAKEASLSANALGPLSNSLAFLEAIVGAAFLFLIGLALRNRFRLKS